MSFLVRKSIWKEGPGPISRLYPPSGTWRNVHPQNVLVLFRPRWNVRCDIFFLWHIVPVIFWHLFATSRDFKSIRDWAVDFSLQYFNIHPLLPGMWHFVSIWNSVTCTQRPCYIPSRCRIMSKFYADCDILLRCDISTVRNEAVIHLRKVCHCVTQIYFVSAWQSTHRGLCMQNRPISGHSELIPGRALALQEGVVHE